MQTDTAALPIGKTASKERRRQRGVFEKVPGSSTWWIRYTDAEGRFRREKAGTKSAAIDLYRKRKTDALIGKKLPEKLRRATVTFADIARDALAYSKAHKRTFGDDVARMERILGWFRDRSAESVTPQEIERHFEECIEVEEWAPSTVNHYRSLLSLTYRLAIRNGKASSNPARATRHRREDNSRVRYLTDAEDGKLRNAIAEDWPEHMPELDLALHTGLRLSEMYGLDWQDVDLARRLLLVRRGKNGQARYARLNSVALKALGELRKRSYGTGPVIRNLAGEPLCGPRYWFEKAIRKAGLADFHWHDLRHTFASRLTMAGVGLRAVQDALGHKSIAMTVRYSHLSPDFLFDVVEKLVPRPADTVSAERTDTTTDTGAHLPVNTQAVHVQ
ncbi:MAG: tyrosine-type recombinase/integrase [Acidobacteriia bacterium]|nr:tyrosine-type recombinase/integrase [Terriglobia bacterium]